MKRITPLIVLASLMISSCSTRNAYESIQHNERLKCERQPPSEYDECMRQQAQTYQSYKNAREELLKDSE